MNDMNQGIPLRHFTRSLRTGWAWLAAGAVVGLVLSVCVLVFLPTRYTATAVINVEAVSATPVSSDKPASDLLDMQTEAVMAGSYRTADLTAQKLDGRLSAKQIRSGTTVGADPDGTIIRVRFTDEDHDLASEVADGIALSYLEVRHDRVLERSAQAREAIDQRLNDLNREVDSASYPGADTTREQAEINSLVAARADLLNVTAAAGQLITPAAESPVHPDRSRSVVLAGGVLLGLVAGAVIALVRGRRNRTVGARQDLEALVTVPVWTSDPDPAAISGTSWQTTRELFRQAVDQRDAMVVVALGGNGETTLARHLVDAVPEGGPEIGVVAADASRAAALAAVQEMYSVVLVVPESLAEKSLVDLLELLDQVPSDLVAVVLSDAWAPAPAPASATDQA